jgi:hypothetical protein
VVVFAITVLAAEYAVFLLFWTVETSAIKTTEKWIAGQSEH